jgi:TolA-binding protein
MDSKPPTSPISTIPPKRSFAIPPSVAGSDTDTASIASLDSRVTTIEAELTHRIKGLQEDLTRRDEEISSLHKYLQEREAYEIARRKKQEEFEERTRQQLESSSAPTCIIL